MNSEKFADTAVDLSLDVSMYVQERFESKGVKLNKVIIMVVKGDEVVTLVYPSSDSVETLNNIITGSKQLVEIAEGEQKEKEPGK